MLIGGLACAMRARDDTLAHGNKHSGPCRRAHFAPEPFNAQTILRLWF